MIEYLSYALIMTILLGLYIKQELKYKLTRLVIFCYISICLCLLCAGTYSPKPSIIQEAQLDVYRGNTALKVNKKVVDGITKLDSVVVYKNK